MAQLDCMVNRQALLICHVDDFRLMLFVTLSAVVLVPFRRRPPAPARQGNGGIR